MNTYPSPARKSDVERAAVTDENVAALKALVPGMPVMYYRSALANTEDLAEAADWLRHKQRSLI